MANDYISIKELIEARQQEMDQMLPGFQTQVTSATGEVVATLYSPTKMAYFRKKKEDKNNG